MRLRVGCLPQITFWEIEEPGPKHIVPVPHLSGHRIQCGGGLSVARVSLVGPVATSRPGALRRVEIGTWVSAQPSRGDL